MVVRIAHPRGSIRCPAIIFCAGMKSPGTGVENLCATGLANSGVAAVSFQETLHQ
jgi:hypothetical protein